MKLKSLIGGGLFCSQFFAYGLKVLVNDSFHGSSSPSAWITQEFKKQCHKCVLEFVPAGDFIGLYQRLRDKDRKFSNSRKKAQRGVKTAFDYVIGLDGSYYREALEKKLIEEGRIIDRGTFALIADSEKIKLNRRKTYSWKELEPKLKGKVIVQDPRFSSVGVGWLRMIYQQQGMGEQTAKNMVARTFPSWQPAYSAFLKGVAPVVWSYATSEAYHVCEEKTSRYFAIRLQEGYPEQQEWAARVESKHRTSKDKMGLKILEKIIFSKQGQLKIAKTNWMFPGIEGVSLPSCFKGAQQIKAWTPRKNASVKDLRLWKDQWSL